MHYISLRTIFLASLSVTFFNCSILLAQQNKQPAIRSHKPHQAKNTAIHKEQQNIKICKAFSPSQLSPPGIAITKVKQSSSLKGGKYKVEGIIDGVCLKEAGLYIGGSRVLKFNLAITPSYKRYDFQLEITADDNPEIRAFDINWRRTSVMLMKSVDKK